MLNENWGGIIEIMTQEVQDPENMPENIRNYIQVLKHLEEAKSLGEIKRCFCICEQEAEEIMAERRRDFPDEKLDFPEFNFLSENNDLAIKKSILTNRDVNYINSKLLDEIQDTVSLGAIPYDKIAQKRYDYALKFFLKRVPVDNYYTAMQISIENNNLNMVNELVALHNYGYIINNILLSIETEKLKNATEIIDKLSKHYEIQNYIYLRTGNMQFVQRNIAQMTFESTIKALHTSVEEDNTELVDYFLEKCIEKNHSLRQVTIREILNWYYPIPKSCRMINKLLDIANEVGNRFETIGEMFLTACKEQDIPTMNRIFPLGVIPTFRIKALYNACLEDKPQTIYRLLEWNTQLPNNAETILDLASRKGYDNIIEELIRQHLVKDIEYPFVISVKNGFERIVSLLLPFATEKGRETALLESVKRENFPITNILLSSCLFSVEIFQKAFDICIENGDEKLIDLFIGKNNTELEEMDERTKTRERIFLSACKYGHLPLVKKFFLKEVQQQGIKIAIQHNHIHVLQFLLDYPRAILLPRNIDLPIQVADDDLAADANVQFEVLLGERMGLRLPPPEFVGIGVVCDSYTDILKYAIENSSAKIVQILLGYTRVDKSCLDSVLKCENAETLALLLPLLRTEIEADSPFLQSLYEKHLRNNNIPLAGSMNNVNIEIMKVLLDFQRPPYLEKYSIDNLEMGLLFMQKGVKLKAFTRLINSYSMEIRNQ